MSAYRSTASFGKRYEYIMIAELLKQEFDVYMTLVDDQGIDCIIRLSDACYLDIQIKARSSECKHPTFFAGMNLYQRKNYYFMFYTALNDSIWIIPSLAVKALSSTNKTGINKGKSSLLLPKQERSKIGGNLAFTVTNKALIY